MFDFLLLQSDKSRLYDDDDIILLSDPFLALHKNLPWHVHNFHQGVYPCIHFDSKSGEIPIGVP